MPLQRGTACLPCRHRKLKCDGQRPACTPCMKHDREGTCSYEDPRSWGKHRQLQLQIGDLQRRLESTRGQVEYLTAALHSYCPPTTMTSMEEKPTGAPSGSMHSQLPVVSTPDTISERINADLISSPFIEYVQQDLMGDGYTNASPDNPPEEFTSELPPRTPSPPSSHFQLQVTAESQGMLLRAFCPHSEQFHLDLTAKQVMSRMEGPSHSLLHDSLLHAIFLIGCRFDELTLSPRHEARFRQRVQGSLRLPTTCQAGQRDCIRAACLLACYFYAVDCMSEAQQHVKVASCLANSMSLESPLGGVSLEEELLLQQIYTTERLIGAYLGAGEVFLGQFEVAGMPSGVSQLPFQTRLNLISAWTARIEACRLPDQTTSSCTQSEMELLDRKVFSAMRARAADLLWIASRSTAPSRPSSSSQAVDPATIGGVHIDMASTIGKLKGCLPSQPRGPMQHSFLSLHTQVYAGLLQILRSEPMCPKDVCEGLVGELIALIRELWDHDYKYLEPIMGLCWQWLIEHLLDCVHQQDDHADQLGELIKFTLLAMHKLAWHLPVIVNIANVAARCSEWGISPISW